MHSTLACCNILHETEYAYLGHVDVVDAGDLPDGGDGTPAVAVVDADEAAVGAARHDEVLALGLG